MLRRIQFLAVLSMFALVQGALHPALAQDPPRGLGESCTSSSQCITGASCYSGVCGCDTDAVCPGADNFCGTDTHTCGNDQCETDYDCPADSQCSFYLDPGHHPYQCQTVSGCDWGINSCGEFYSQMEMICETYYNSTVYWYNCAERDHMCPDMELFCY